VPHPPPSNRGHLRLAPPPSTPAPRDARILLVVSAAAATVALVFRTLRAWLSTALALAPLLWRRAPVGGRLRPLRAADARIIPFPQQRRAQEQQSQALPR
jgi:hypothetical protein